MMQYSEKLGCEHLQERFRYKKVVIGNVLVSRVFFWRQDGNFCKFWVGSDSFAKGRNDQRIMFSSIFPGRDSPFRGI